MFLPILGMPVVILIKLTPPSKDFKTLPAEPLVVKYTISLFELFTSTEVMEA